MNTKTQNTPAQNAARAINGKRGGRPGRVCVTCCEPVGRGRFTFHANRALDDTCKGRHWKWQKPADRRPRIVRRKAAR